MTERKKYIWKGINENKYTYLIYPLFKRFEQDQNGNYIYAKVVNNQWKPIYIGEGDLGDRIGSQHHQADCIKSKKATHVHVHFNEKKQTHKNEEKTFLQITPSPSNPKDVI